MTVETCSVGVVSVVVAPVVVSGVSVVSVTGVVSVVVAPVVVSGVSVVSVTGVVSVVVAPVVVSGVSVVVVHTVVDSVVSVGGMGAVAVPVGVAVGAWVGVGHAVVCGGDVHSLVGCGEGDSVPSP